jgi:hypothetical protein
MSCRAKAAGLGNLSAGGLYFDQQDRDGGHQHLGGKAAKLRHGIHLLPG